MSWFALEPKKNVALRAAHSTKNSNQKAFQMASKPHKPSEEPRHANGETPLTPDEGSSPMANPQYRNGPDLSPDRVAKQRNILAFITYLMENRALAGAIVGALGIGGGAVAALVPVRHGEFDQFKTDISAEIRVIKEKVDTHDSTLQRLEDKTDKILFKLTIPAAPVPAAIQESPPQKPSPKRRAKIRPSFWKSITR